MTGISFAQWLWYSLFGIILVAGAGALALRSNRRESGPSAARPPAGRPPAP